MSVADSLMFATMTLAVYCLAKLVRDRLKSSIFNPMLMSMIVLIIAFKLCHIDYERYMEGGDYIAFWLKPAVVSLGLPLYRQLRAIRSQFAIIFLAQLAGCIVGIVSAVLLARICGASDAVCLSLAPKSVTTPIAIEVTQVLGGIAPLTAAIVIIVGVYGSIIGFKLMKLCGITSPMSQSLAMGTGAHAMGTAEAATYGERFGAYAGLGIILNGILTAIIAPYIVPYLI
jgi:predicted murein hydrolase (TIGR00659 family)